MPPIPVVTIGPASVVEGDGADVTLRFTATLDRPSAEDVSFLAQTISNGATPGTDYDEMPSTTLHIAPGETATVVDVTVHGDTAYESPSERLWLMTTEGVGATVSSFLTNGVILDDDAFTPEPPRLTTADASAVEGDAGVATISFVLSLDRPATTPVSVDIATATFSASSPDDFEAIPTTTVTFDPGQTTVVVPVTVHGDTDLDEVGERFFVQLSNPVDLVLDAFGVSGHIIDDDDLDATTPPITLSTRHATVAEGASGTDTALRVAITLDRAADVPVFVRVATDDVSATVADGDYDAVDQVVVFPAGTVVKDVIVPVHGDDLDEGLVEFLLVHLSSPSGAVLAGADWQATIVDDDLTTIPPAIVRIDPASVIEGDAGDRPLRFHLTLDRPVDHAVDVQVATRPVFGDEGDDFDPLSSTTVHLDAGDSIAAIDVTVHGDTVDDPSPQGVYLEASGATGADLSYVGLTGAGLIYDDDAKAIPAPHLSIGPASVVEGDGPDVTLHVPVVLHRAVATPVSVHVATSDGSATTADDDYEAVSTTITFDPGVQVRDVPVTVHGDVFDDGDAENFSVELSAPTGATLATGSAVATIWDDDEPNPGQLRFTGAAIATNEADGADPRRDPARRRDRGDRDRRLRDGRGIGRRRCRLRVDQRDVHLGTG